MKNNNAKFKTGFTLLETLVAVTVLVFAIIGPLELASRSIGSAIISQNQIIAFYLGQEAMEFVRNKRDSNLSASENWLKGLDKCKSSNGCYVDAINNEIEVCSDECPAIKYNDETGYNYNEGNNTIFFRSVKIINPAGSYNDEAKIETNISWTEKSGIKSFVLEEYIYDWK